MEMVLEVILRVLLIGYYLMMAVFVIRQIRIRFLADEKYALYANYVNDQNRKRYGCQVNYYKALVRGTLVQLGAILLGMALIDYAWFMWMSIVAIVCTVLEPLFVMVSFPKLVDFKYRTWLLLYLKRLIGIVLDGYIIFALAVVCFIY